ncbi:hypothetical protein IWQ60_003365 [Tieghemiomyces parasiticus]|uniref:Uncharacterized protein n=1 Tax=Tieghemiomyces parasiticus TaxID=78921 RepID=A0A9W8E097_9FUNG|nr:hypothetical protein IWQ60_003365 [Tieghemiomyces parasiticus]
MLVSSRLTVALFVVLQVIALTATAKKTTSTKTITTTTRTSTTAFPTPATTNAPSAIPNQGGTDPLSSGGGGSVGLGGGFHW